ncbi:MAG TPA: DUF262 domain-containing protein [Solirubrobacterales bacterium]|jgi:uncharacterized protein with ParB-like and HNH nuclease domain
MQTFEIEKTQYKVADFIDWQRGGTLDLAPVFQRRTVWKPGAKSYLIDTVARGLPTPIIFLRDRIELKTMKATREVVDGQQRLRTLISFIAPRLLPDYDPEQDDFKVKKNHNVDLAGKKFSQLDDAVQHQLLNYSFSTHVLPTSVEDRDVLHIFQRLNSTGEKLTPQELRNAEFFGEFKTLMYQLALEQLDRWRQWSVFSGDEIARMKEVELTSDLVVAMVNGFGGKSQAAIKKAYNEYDESFPQGKEITRRFRMTMDVIDEVLGQQLPGTIFNREIWFIVLAYYSYRRIYGSSPSSKKAKPGKMPKDMRRRLIRVSNRVTDDTELPSEVVDALRGASSDKGSRLARLAFISDNV